MKIGLIIIGDELLIGSTQDCNMLYLGKKLALLGMKLDSCHVIADEKAVIQQVFKNAMEEYDITFCSGGLGPTIDDRTKNALATFINSELEDNPKARLLAQKHYDRRGLEWFPELNNYHMIPKGVEPYLNPKGLAPGLYFKNFSGRELLCAPGVPREFQGMIDHYFSESPLGTKYSSRRSLTIRTAGIPEEQIFNKKSPTLWKALSQFGQVSSYPRFTGIDIVINDISVRENELIEKLESLPELLPVKNHIWHFGNGPIEEIVIKFANSHGLTISTAESCTGGLIAHQLTEISGSSEVFHGSVVSYANSIKETTLGVKKESLNQFGAVSEQVAMEMAKGARAQMKTTYAVSTSGIAGPLGGSEEKPVGTVAIAIDGPNGVSSKMYQIPAIFDRDEMKKRFATRALISLYKLMKNDFLDKGHSPQTEDV